MTMKLLSNWNFKSEKSIKKNLTKMVFNNLYSVNDPKTNDKEEINGIFIIPFYNIFLAFNHSNNKILSFEIKGHKLH